MKLISSIFSNPTAKVAINLQPRKGSWGGANQWTSQLSRWLRYHGWKVQYDLKKIPDVIMMTHTGLSEGTSFGAEEVADLKKRHPHVPCIQRINDNDLRKGSSEMDQFLAKSNRVADHTVFVSQWLRDHHGARWFDLSKPHSVITPGADLRFFHPIGTSLPAPGAPLRLVTHHWSDNWKKGFDVYQQIDEWIAAQNLSSKSTASANNCVASSASSSINETLLDAPSTPYSWPHSLPDCSPSGLSDERHLVSSQETRLSASATFKTGCSKVELWIIGRWPKEIQWKAARTFGPASGAQLATLLRQCHAYVSASRYEPGAMHIAEGLQCGLPLLYHRDTGGTVEQGLRYGMEIGNDLSETLHSFSEQLPLLRAKLLADPPSGSKMSLEYLQLLQRTIIT